MSGLNQQDENFFQAKGYQTKILPLTEIKLYTPTDFLFNQLKQSEWVFFTSQAAVKNILPLSNNEIKIAVIGKKTAQVVYDCGRIPTFVSSTETKRAMLKEWQECYPEPTTIFYPKSQLADDYIETELSANYKISSFIAYQNCCPPTAKKDLRTLLSSENIQAVYLTSPSSWKRFLSVYQEFKTKLVIFTIGETTKQAVLRDGYEAKIIGNIE